LAIERGHEAKALGQGFTFLHMQNMSIRQMMIEVILRAAGTYWWGPCKRGKGATEAKRRAPSTTTGSFLWFTILHLNDLHVSGKGHRRPAMRARWR
jgi:hypothetical protein